MKTFSLIIYGTEWIVKIGPHSKLPGMAETSSGYTDLSVKEIGIEDLRSETGLGCCQDQYKNMKEVLRHEIAHAALMESGLRACRSYDHEQIADWICITHHKLHGIIVEAESKFDSVMKEV